MFSKMQVALILLALGFFLGITFYFLRKKVALYTVTFILMILSKKEKKVK